MHNLYTKFVKILEIWKLFSEILVNEHGNISWRGPIPKFSVLEVVALSLAAESESIDSEKWLVDYRLQEYKDKLLTLISHRLFNDCRKDTAGLCEEICRRVAMKMGGAEELFFVDSQPIEVCRVARGKRCRMGRTGDFSQAPDFGYCASVTLVISGISCTLSLGWPVSYILATCQRPVSLTQNTWKMGSWLITIAAYTEIRDISAQKYNSTYSRRYT